MALIVLALNSNVEKTLSFEFNELLWRSGSPQCMTGSSVAQTGVIRVLVAMTRDSVLPCDPTRGQSHWGIVDLYSAPENFVKPKSLWRFPRSGGQPERERRGWLRTTCLLRALRACKSRRYNTKGGGGGYRQTVRNPYLINRHFFFLAEGSFAPFGRCRGYIPGCCSSYWADRSTHWVLGCS